MAPTGQRRSSYSRRAQYNLFTGYIIAGIGALVGAVLLGLSFFQPDLFGGARGRAADAATPATETAAAVRTGTKGFYDTISGYFAAGSKNAALQREMEIARIRLAEAASLKRENRELKALLGLTESESRPVALARIVSSTSTSTRRFAYISVGLRDGVRPGMPVRSPRGVIGRVLEVSPQSARVLLLTDSESVLPVRRARDEVVAFAEGRGDSLLHIRLINLGINPLKKGDMLVTSGAGGYYRPGQAVAIVTELVSDGALARIVSDPAATDYVAVEAIYEPAAQQVIAPPPTEPAAD